MKSLIEEASTITKAVEKAWIRAGKPAEFTVKVFEEPKYNFLGMTTKSAKVAIFFKSTDPIPSTMHHEKKEAKPSYKDQQNKNRPSRPSQDHHNSRTSHHKNYDTENQDDRDQRSSAMRPQKNERRTPRDYPKQSDNMREQRPQVAPRENREQKERYEQREPRQEHNNTPDSRSRGPQERRSYRDREERPEAIWSNEMADIAQDWLENMLIMLEKREQLVQAKVVGSNLKFEFREPLIQDKEKEKLLFASWAHLILATVGNKYKKDLRGLKIVLSSVE